VYTFEVSAVFFGEERAGVFIINFAVKSLNNGGKILQGGVFFFIGDVT